MSRKELLELSEQDVIDFLIGHGVNVVTESNIDEELDGWFEYYKSHGGSFLTAVLMVAGEPYLDGGAEYYILEQCYNYPHVECDFDDLESLIDYCEEQGYIDFEE